jgi:hypothetical protein
MISKVWYPVNYFRLSFGKQDKLADAVQSVKKTLEFEKDIDQERLKENIKDHLEQKEIKRSIHNLSRFVPYRFLSPWFSSELRGMPDQRKDRAIVDFAARDFIKDENPPPYRFDPSRGTIVLHSGWRDYFTRHVKILRGYTLWHLLDFLRKRNPNVPNIQTKLFPPQQRELKRAKDFWNLYFDIWPGISCIYSGELVTPDNYSIDHFVPWSFDTHNQLWNLLPVPHHINSSKGDRLPAQKHLEDFEALQYDAFHRVLQKLPGQAKLMEDYNILFNDSLENIRQKPRQQFRETLGETIRPLMQIAGNMGFEEEWRYR